jgi:hypothetical protein
MRVRPKKWRNLPHWSPKFCQFQFGEAFNHRMSPALALRSTGDDHAPSLVPWPISRGMQSGPEQRWISWGPRTSRQDFDQVWYWDIIDIEYIQYIYIHLHTYNIYIYHVCVYINYIYIHVYKVYTLATPGICHKVGCSESHHVRCRVSSCSQYSNGD